MPNLEGDNRRAALPAARLLPGVIGDTPAPRSPSIVIFNDQTALAEGLSHALARVHGIATIGITSRLEELRDLVGRRPPDVVLVDVRAEDVGEALQWLEEETVRVRGVRMVTLVDPKSAAHVEMTRRRGAAGCVVKSSSLSTIAHAVRVVAAGGSYFETDVATPPEHSQPSARELELMYALARGHTNVQTGHLMAISSRTVESHVRRLFARYGVSSRTQLLMLAVREGWVTPDESLASRAGSQLAG